MLLAMAVAATPANCWTGPAKLSETRLTSSVAGASGELSHDGGQGRPVPQTQEAIDGGQRLSRRAGCIRTAHARSRVRGPGPARQAISTDPWPRRSMKRCAACWPSRGRVIVTGIGKSGHVGQKIAATFASTGTPAFFVHPSEASHGDLGMITPRRRASLALSWSGETRRAQATSSPIRAASRCR